MGSSWTGDRTYVPSTGRMIINHWTTREVPGLFLNMSARRLWYSSLSSLSSESEVAQSCLTLCDLMDHSLLVSVVHGMAFPGKNTGVGCHFLLRGSSQPRDWTLISQVSCIGRWFTTVPSGKPIAIFISHTAKFRVPSSPTPSFPFQRLQWANEFGRWKVLSNEG